MIKISKIKNKRVPAFVAICLLVLSLGLIYHFYLAQAFVANDGVVFYGYNNGTSSNRGRIYDNNYTNSSNSVGSRVTGLSSTTSPIQFVVAKSAPTRAERMIGQVKVTGRLDLLSCTTGCNSSSDFTARWNTTAVGTMTSSTVSRPFDIAYEQLSGRAMVVYAGNTTGKLYYCIWDGTSWGPVSNCAPTNGTNDISLTDGTTSLTGTPRWVKLASYGAQMGDYRSNNLLLAVEDSNSDEMVISWNGSSWNAGDSQVITTTGGSNLISQSFDVAYESVSGLEMVVYANGSTLSYRTSSGSGWSAATNVQATSPGTVKWAEMASDSRSNRLSLIITFGAVTNRVYVWKTDGSTAGWTAGSSDLTAETDTGKNVSTAWEKANSGAPQAMFIGTASNALVQSYRTWTQSGGFTSWTSGSGNDEDDTNTHDLEASPNSDIIMDATDDIDGRMRMRSWTGSAWNSIITSSNLPSTLAYTTSNSSPSTNTNTNHAQKSYDFVYKPYAAWSKNWQWFDDENTNGNPQNASAAEDTTATAKPNNIMRLRMNIEEVGNMAQTDTRKKLQYSTGTGCPDSTSCVWTDVGAQGSASIWRYGNGGLTDDAIIPSTMLDGSTNTGTVVENGTAAAPNSDQNALTTNEYDFTIQNNGSVIGNTYYFRAYDYGASESGGSLTNLNAIFRYQQTDINGTESTTCTANFVASTCTYPSLFSYTSSPHKPIIYRPSDGGTNVSTTPLLQLRSSDDENDYIDYMIEYCPTNSWPCASGGGFWCQLDTIVTPACTGTQANWSGQDANSGISYTGSATEANSTMALYQVQPGVFKPNTTYYLRAKAIDPDGSGTFSLYSDTVSFTTASLEVLLRGGATINGGTILANYGFGSNGVIDNFNRAGSASPPSGSWTLDGIHACSLKLSNDSSTVTNSNAGTAFCGNYYNASQYGPNTEAYATVSTLPASSEEAVSLYGRVQNPASGTAFNAYGVEFDNTSGGTNAIKFKRYNNNSLTSLSTTNLGHAIAAGESFGISITGNSTVTITAWYKQSGGNWTAIASYTDSSGSRLTGSGYLGLEMHATLGISNKVDDFGGGTY